MERWIRVLAVLVAFTACRSEHSRDDHEALATTLRSCSSNKDLGCPRPILWVGKLDDSIRYYRERLGFRFDWTDGDPPDFASVTRGDTQIFMCQRCQGHAGSWIWMSTPDVDALYDDFVARGAIIRARPENKPWGMREMQVADPDGNVLRIGSPIRGQ
jgi:catechol 2,3-dioxygenase-like lactoylglutathione lyase family enzyme